VNEIIVTNYWDFLPTVRNISVISYGISDLCVNPYSKQSVNNIGKIGTFVEKS